MKKKHGFTLAEVLITLMIIGIVAALTIPSVISNYQQQQFKTGLKKAVSVLNEAIQMNIAQEGETPYENEDIFAYLKRHMSIMKSGGAGSDSLYSGNLFFFTTDGMRFEFPYNRYTHPIQFENTNIILHETGLNVYESRLFNKHYNNDGNLDSYSWQPGYAKCGSYGLGSNPNNTKWGPCVIMVDVNGDKKPNPVFNENHSEYNQFGYDVNITYPSPKDKKLQDVFLILITDEKAIPFGVVAQRAMYSK